MYWKSELSLPRREQPRARQRLSPRSDNKIALEAPELEGLEVEWDIPELPWNLLPLHTDGLQERYLGSPSPWIALGAPGVRFNCL
jgi:hypothetical protein